MEFLWHEDSSIKTKNWLKLLFWGKICLEVFAPKGAQNEVFQNLWKINEWKFFAFLHEVKAA